MPARTLPGLVVDLRPVSNAHSRRGIGRYVRGLACPVPVGAKEITERRGFGVPGVRATSTGWRVTLPPRPRLRCDPWAAHALQTPLERSSASLVHLTDPYSYEFAPRHKRLLATVYDLLLLDGSDRLSGRLTRGVRALAERPDVTWLAISETTRVELMSRLHVPGDRVVVVVPGPTAWPESGSYEQDCLLYLGALDAHKRPTHALEAGRLSGLPVQLAGRLDPVLVRALGLSHSSLLSGLDDAALAARLRGARALIHPSAAEGFGLTVLEALSLGTPVVAYDLAVTREIVGADYPLVPEAEGPAGMARLARELGDPDLRRQVLASASASIARFDWARSREALMSLYEQLT